MNTQYQQLFQQAQALLQQNRAADCIALCQQMLRAIPREPNAGHLLAVALLRAGQPQEAERQFEKLIKAAPKNAELMVGHANVLRSLGRLKEAEHRLRKALRIAPDSPAALYTLALLLFNDGRLDEADRHVSRLLGPAQLNPAIWELAAAIAQQSGKPITAIKRCRDALAVIPSAPRLHYSLAQLLRQECDFEAAAESYAEARRLGFEDPDLYRNGAEALLDGGHVIGACDFIRQGVDRYPGHALLQRTAARLHASAAAPGDPLAKLDAAALAGPTNAPLWQALVELLKRLDRGDEASEKLRRARELGCPDSPEILVLEALDAAYHDDPQESVRRFDALLSQFPENPYVLRNFAMQLLTNGDAERAASVCEAGLVPLPFDQTLLAYQSTAWQLLGDAREHWLCDYQNMVVPVPVPLPGGFASRDEFFAALTAVLERLHHSNAQPIEQSVRGGTQTNGFLFRLKEPLLAVLENQIREAIVSALMTFPDEARHPFWGRRHRNPHGDGLRFSGAWSVRLRDQGFHSNHIHPEGWISSALYIALPEEVQQGQGTEGHIQFGTPMRELGLALPPRRIVKPEVGTLVLFPSYMWHGTLPFHSDQSRITVAFDLLPEA